MALFWSGYNDRPESIAEEYLLGKKRFDKHNAETSADEYQRLLQRRSGPLSASSTIHSATEMETKLREDPLFTIKRKEQEMAERLAKNPYKLARLQQQQQESERRRAFNTTDRTDARPMSHKRRSRSKSPSRVTRGS